MSANYTYTVHPNYRNNSHKHSLTHRGHTEVSDGIVRQFYNVFQSDFHTPIDHSAIDGPILSTLHLHT